MGSSTVPMLGYHQYNPWPRAGVATLFGWWAENLPQKDWWAQKCVQ